MKNCKKLLSVLCILLCSLLVLCACNPSSTVQCNWQLVDLGNGVSQHTVKQGLYLAGDYLDIAKYAKGSEELSRPEPVRLSWSAEKSEEVSIVNYTVTIKDVYEEYKTLSFDTTEPYLDVYNLCIATQYLWQVTAHLSDGSKSESSWATFLTEDVAPRNIYVDGITNVRDLGGWQTPSGRVKQGLIYRCGRLNKSEQPNVEIEITENGIEMMRDRLGIKSEIDLRMRDTHNSETGGITSSPLGEDVKYYNCQLEWDIVNGNYLTGNINAVKYFFELASDINNYPLIFHCNIGTDRTGMFAFLINGLLGVSEEDLYRDYLFSNFGKINNTRTLSNITNNYLATINKYDGDTLSERIENCLIELVGVPQWQLDAIKDILLEA